MQFEIRSSSHHIIDSIYDKAISELNVFFEFNWQHHLPQVFLVPDRKTIDKLTGHQTESWFTAWAEGKRIFMLDPENFEKESSHKFSEKEYKARAYHELCHSFFRAITGSYFPIWLNEGLAVYTSGQLKFKKRPDKFQNFLEYYNKSDKQVYSESGFAVEALINKYGRPNMITLVKELKGIPQKKESFDQLFIQIYQINPVYDSFNRLL